LEYRNIPHYYSAGRVIDASAGANYSGGSSWPGDLPLTPSNAGLANVDQDLVNGYYNRGRVIDASAGANYSGGSSWPGDLPLTPSNAGLAGSYEGRPLEDSDLYGSTMEAVPGYYNAGRVIDASAGANYSGGSSWPGDLPLTPSNAGLAGLDAVPDAMLRNMARRVVGATRAASMMRVAGQKPLMNLKMRIVKIQRLLQSPRGRSLPMPTRHKFALKLNELRALLRAQRMTRGNMLRPLLALRNRRAA
jgi:hypothetical protein